MIRVRDPSRSETKKKWKRAGSSDCQTCPLHFGCWISQQENSHDSTSWQYENPHDWMIIFFQTCSLRVHQFFPRWWYWFFRQLNYNPPWRTKYAPNIYQVWTIYVRKRRFSISLKHDPYEHQFRFLEKNNYIDRYLHCFPEKSVFSRNRFLDKPNNSYLERWRRNVFFFINGYLTPLEPQSRFGDKLLKIWVVCPQNGTAVLKAFGRAHLAVATTYGPTITRARLTYMQRGLNWNLIVTPTAICLERRPICHSWYSDGRQAQCFHPKLFTYHRPV